ncbi:uncharacterized protein [Euphorbia lathyris]|uniref:uncharacterized protein n=1 Tax=Euphorbia lathyris TaxID=212925 RepID=UPI0033132019
MKQSRTTTITTTTDASLRLNYDMDEDEIEVASILLELPSLIASRNRLPLSWPAWGTKRKRSAEEFSLLRRVRSSNSPQSSCQEIIALDVPVVQPEKPAAKVKASSPATPLSFSPSESDGKPKRLKRKLSVKKKKEELLEITKECTITNESLRKEVEQSREYLMRLQSQNFNLKARKQELAQGSKKEKDNDAQVAVEVRSNKLEGEVMNEKVVGASGIPDLNVSLPVWMEFFQPLDDNKSFTKAMAAQARHRRMLICRDKNITITKLRNSRK